MLHAEILLSQRVYLEYCGLKVIPKPLARLTRKIIVKKRLSSFVDV